MDEKAYSSISKFALNYMLRDKDSSSVAYFREEVEPNLKLLQNPRFVAFVTDLAVNTTRTEVDGSDS